MLAFEGSSPYSPGPYEKYNVYIYMEMIQFTNLNYTTPHAFGKYSSLL